MSQLAEVFVSIVWMGAKAVFPATEPYVVVVWIRLVGHANPKTSATSKLLETAAQVYILALSLFSVLFRLLS